ncbi:MAG: hypothetical protein ACT4OD_01420 [Candidatus Nitrosotenuis sp.]
MDKPSPIKDRLYQTIELISESKINHEIIQNNASNAIRQILLESKIETLEGNSTENYETFAESLMHYILTNALIPSQRKLSINQIDIDIVIPDIKTLGLSKKDALVLLFPKTDNLSTIQTRLQNIHTIQPIKENIWLVQKSNLGLPYKTYEIDNECTFVNIIDDIKAKISSRSQSKFKIFKV